MDEIKRMRGERRAGEGLKLKVSNLFLTPKKSR